MADIEKVIKGMDICISAGYSCPESCLYAEEYSDNPDEGCQCFKDALELLKEKQPKKGRWRKSLHLSSQKYYMICTCCQYECQGWDGETGVAYDYCPNCGAEMQNGNTNRYYKKESEQE